MVFVGAEGAGSAASHPNLCVLDLEARRVEIRTRSLQRGLQGWLDVRSRSFSLHLWADLWVTRDDSAAYARVQNGGRMQICRIALTGTELVQPVVGGDRCCILLDMVDERLLFSVDDITHPPELYIATIEGGEERQMTQMNSSLISELELGDCVHLACRGIDGAALEGWYVKPANGRAPPFPTVLWIHGGPFGAQGYSFDFDTALLNSLGIGVMFFNYRGSSGYGDAFSMAPLGDWGNLDYHDLMAGVDAAIAAGIADPERLGVCGNSFGGAMSCFIVGKTQRFQAAVPQNPVTDWQSFYGTSDIGVWFSVEELGGHPHEVPDTYRRCSPITYAHNCRTATLLIQCEEDWRCPPGQSEQFYTVLRANGCDAEMLRLPRCSHLGSILGPLSMRQEYLRSMLEWFTKHLLNPVGENGYEC